MQLELFMRTVSQEYPDDQIAANPELLSYNNKKHRNRFYRALPHAEGSVLKNILVRRETFGGILYDLDSKAVFSMDQEAMDAISALLEGVTFAQLSESPNFSEDGIRTLRESLVRYGLCSN